MSAAGRWHRLLAPVVAGALLAGCSRGEATLDMSAKRENLDLAYKKEELAKKPPTLQQIVDVAPGVPGLPPDAVNVATPVAPTETFTFAPMPVIPDRSCRPARPGTPAMGQTTTFATAAPAVGVYPARQRGMFGVRAGTFNVQGPVAPETQVRIANVVNRSTTDSSGRIQPDILFDEIVPGVDAPTATTYRITGAELQIAKIVSGDHVFEPAPAITILQFRDATGASWTSAGVDLDTTEAMSVEGRIEGRETVDLCGTVIEAYRVSSAQRRVNLRTQYSYETDPSTPKVYDIATQLGALTIRIRERSTTTFVADGTQVTVTVDYTRTLDGPAPAGRP